MIDVIIVVVLLLMMIIFIDQTINYFRMYVDRPDTPILDKLNSIF